MMRRDRATLPHPRRVIHPNDFGIWHANRRWTARCWQPGPQRTCQRVWLIDHERKVVAWVLFIFGALLIISALTELLEFVCGAASTD